jgi:hypothetical protein
MSDHEDTPKEVPAEPDPQSGEPDPGEIPLETITANDEPDPGGLNLEVELRGGRDVIVDADE